jgi:Fur family transcriptional regulator, ferric uptake regulator
MTTRPPAEQGGALLDRFARYLRDRRLPMTRQRLQIAQAVFRSTEHPSVERIRRDLAQRGLRVATATVYRALDLLVQSGLVRRHDFGEGFRRFEASPEHSDHEHLVCQRCGRVVEVRNERLERILEIIADEHQFLQRRHRIEVYGLCSECRGRDAAALRATMSGR